MTTSVNLIFNILYPFKEFYKIVDNIKLFDSFNLSVMYSGSKENSKKPDQQGEGAKISFFNQSPPDSDD